MESLHYEKIAKRAFERIWDTLSNRDRQIIAEDVHKETQLAKWFYQTVWQTAQSRYESATYWLNDWETFKHPRHEFN